MTNLQKNEDSLHSSLLPLQRYTTTSYSTTTQRLWNERSGQNYYNMLYAEPIVEVQSAVCMADCRKGPCGRPSCTKKPSGQH